ncbi:MAG TPA: hypothetical protein VEK08_26975 [Planctomycetota bacterium]|nr:hypothetical protein [Planctomycetota bacterium]
MPGFPTSVAPGEHEEFLLEFDVKKSDTGTGAVVWLQAASGYGDTWWAIVVDGAVVAIVYLEEGADAKPFEAPYGNVQTAPQDHAVSVAPLGDWDDDTDIDVSLQQEYFTEDKGKNVLVNFAAIMSVEEAYNDSGQLSNWSLTGLSRFATSRAVEGRSTQAKIDITLTNNAGVYTVKLLLNGIVLASGSRTGNGVVTLTAENNSGLSGSVTVTYTADITEDTGAYVLGRWAARYTVVVAGTSVTVNDSGRGDRLSVVVGPIAAGVQTVTVTPISDTGVTGSTFTDSITVPGRPEPPGVLSVVAGGAWNATDIQFVPSSTVGATYVLYDSELDQPIAVTKAAAVHAAGTYPTPITWRIPNLAGAAAGYRRLIVVAVLGNVEDGLRRRLKIEYDSAGNVKLPRPNIPEFRWQLPEPFSGGRTANVEWSYNSAGQEGVATKVLLYLLAEGAAIPADGAAANAEQSIGTAVDGLYQGTLTFNAPANGHFRALVRAATAAGAQSLNNTALDPQLASNAVLPAPTDVAISVVS